MASAEQLLREIPSESLQQLLLSVQQDSQAPLKTCIPALDSYLSRDSHTCLHSGDVIHLQGQSGSGKTHLLYFLLATCTMPPEYLLNPLGGWHRVAVVFDMDGTFDTHRFHGLLSDRLQRLLPSVSIAPIVERCLKSLHIFQPTSTDQLAVTLAHLPKYHAKHFPESEMGMVAVHSIDAFYWLDRFKSEQLRGFSTSTKTNSYQNISAKLRDLRRSHGIITVVTHWALPHTNTWTAPSAAVGNPPSDQSFVPQRDLYYVPPHLLSLPITCHICLDIGSRSTGSTDEVASHTFKATIRTAEQPHKTSFSYEINEHGIHLK